MIFKAILAVRTKQNKNQQNKLNEKKQMKGTRYTTTFRRSNPSPQPAGENLEKLGGTLGAPCVKSVYETTIKPPILATSIDFKLQSRESVCV